MTKPVLTSSKMPGETEQQYTAWILYCEAGSIPKTIKAWEQLRRGIGDASGVFGGKLKELGALPAERNIESWSSKFRWVERKDLKLSEDLEGLRKKAKDVKERKVYAIVDIFWDKVLAIKKQAKQGEPATIDELKKLWEMVRTEFGESLGKHDFALREEDQKPPTPEEMSEIEDISQEFKTFYDNKRRGHPRKKAGDLLGDKKQNKE